MSSGVMSLTMTSAAKFGKRSSRAVAISASAAIQICRVIVQGLQTARCSSMRMRNYHASHQPRNSEPVLWRKRHKLFRPE